MAFMILRVDPGVASELDVNKHANSKRIHLASWDRSEAQEINYNVSQPAVLRQMQAQTANTIGSRSISKFASIPSSPSPREATRTGQNRYIQWPATQQRKPELREPESFINGMTVSAFSPEGGAASIFQGCIYTCILEKIRERACQPSTSRRRLPPCFASDVGMTVMQREGQVEGEGHQVV